MKEICCNCKHAGHQFKINKITHLHCEDPKQYNDETCNNDNFSPWETLRTFGDTCKSFEPKK